MKMKKIIWAESFHEEEAQARQLWGKRIPIEFYRMPLQEIADEAFVPGTVVAIRTHSKMLSSQKNQIVGVVTRSTGYDHIGNQYTEIPTGYLPDYATRAVAEYNLMAGLNLLRQSSEAQEAVDSFKRSGLTGRELQNLTVGIVGVGRIGQETARIFSVLGCELLGHDKVKDKSWADSVGLSYTSLHRLFEQSRLVILALPFTKETFGLIELSHLERMPEGGYLVNSGRGEVVRNRDLFRALNDGPLSGLALDVFNREDTLSSHLRSERRPGTNSPEISAAMELLSDSRVVATPHNAFNTGEALTKKVKRTLESFRKFEKSGQFPTPVPEHQSPGE